MFKGMRAAAAPPKKEFKKNEDLSGVPLVKCLKCGTWVPRTKALRLGPSAYCSTTCVERSEVRV
jgi:ribosomal protein S26